MNLDFEIMAQRIWTITEAKARLSEVLRCAEEDGPQRIGARKAYFVVAEAEWQRLQTPRPRMGEWLLKNVPQSKGLELPSREEPIPSNPFGDDAAR